jgi:quercetin dioxygenase-like cupin family protein
MKIYSAEHRPSKKASSNWFSGTVWQDPIIETPAPARVHALKVAFEPSARTAWHTHPLGQTLHVLSGVGLVQLRGQAAQKITAGDTGLDRTGRRTLARRYACACDDPYRHSRKLGWNDGELAE